MSRVISVAAGVAVIVIAYKMLTGGPVDVVAVWDWLYGASLSVLSWTDTLVHQLAKGSHT